MGNLARGAWRRAVLVAAVVLLTVQPGPAAGQSIPVDPPEARVQPPVGVTAQARVQPPVGSDRSFAKLVMTWLRARISIPNG